ncbi:MAG: efflux RND transporter permease subunit [Planctomycetota bacterium]|nr:efflux RND transporter permease subunit [Planctomycetota bacterium]
MNPAQLAMRYRPIVVSVVLMMTFWGIITFQTMSRREDPAFTIRTCVVSTRWPGSPTIKVEELVTYKLEEAIDGLQEVDKIESTTIDGLSTIYVDLSDDVAVADIQNVWDKIRARVELVPMPDSRIRPVVNDSFGDTSVLVLAIYQKPLPDSKEVDEFHRYSPRQLELIADQLRDSFRLLDGVASVDKYGITGEAIYIETDSGTWSNLELTIGSLRQAVSERNIVVSGGSIDTAEGKFSIMPSGEFNLVDEIRSITIGASTENENALPIKLEDVGLKVMRGYENPRKNYCRYTDSSGSYPAVILGVTMKSGSNIIDVCKSCMQQYRQLAEIEQVVPRDIGVTPVSMQSDNVTQKISDVISNVIAAIVIVVIVVWLFVGARTALVMAANIPVVVMVSIAIVSQFGVELEQISLASIIIALGLLVDNAVQVCDQTRVNLLQGMKPMEAAIDAGKTLMFPMLVGTLTTVAAFFPMLIALKGGGAEYIYSLPVTLSTTLILSWILAMTICVILAAAIIRPPANPDAPAAPLPWINDLFTRWIRKFRRGAKNEQADSTATSEENLFLAVYGWLILKALDFKWWILGISVVLVFLATKLPIATEFFPQDRRDQFFVNVVLPETATIEETDQVVRQLEQMIRRLSPARDASGNTVERLRAMRSLVGGGGSRWALGVSPLSPATNVAQLLIRTNDGKSTPGFIADIRRVSETGDPSLGLEPITGARIIPKALSLGPPAEPVVIRVSGPGFADIPTLRKIAKEVKHVVSDHPDTWDVNDTWGIDGFQVDVEINEVKANLSGVTNSNVADSLAAYYDGVELSKFLEGDHQVPIYFRLQQGGPDASSRDNRNLNSLSTLDTVFVEGSVGKIPLNSIAGLDRSFQPAKIERRNSNRTIEVKSEVGPSVSGNDVVKQIMARESMKKIIETLPAGYRIEVGGSYEESQDSSVQMLTSFAISLVAIVLILVVQYNGWSKTTLILTTLPMALIGAFLGLWMTDNPLGFMPQLGLLSLFGIVLNTGVIFIEFADILIEEKRASGATSGPISGLTREEFRGCLVQAGKQRMLPIFLTTATTVGGLIPLGLSGGPLWEGLAWLMVYGLLVATVLTLIVLPALYAILVEALRIKPVG